MRRTRKRWGFIWREHLPFKPSSTNTCKNTESLLAREHIYHSAETRAGGSGEEAEERVKSLDLNEREWPLALLHGVGVWEQPEQRPLWLIGLIWQQGKKRSLKGPSGYSFHHLTCLIWTHSYSHQRSFYSGSFALRFTFPLSHFNNRLSSSNEATVEPSEVTWLSKMSLSISQRYMKMPLPGVLGWPCS